MTRLRNVEFLATLNSLSAKTTAWANLVVSNGGAVPSGPTLAAVDVWYKALVTAGIDSLMVNVGFFAPDSIIAARTPYFHTSSPGFASGAYGWFSASRTATNLTTAYCANGAVPFASFGSSAAASGSVAPGAGANGIGWNSPGVAAGISQGATLSFMGCHHGLTSTQSQALFNATQTLRQAFGGGFS